MIVRNEKLYTKRKLAIQKTWFEPAVMAGLSPTPYMVEAAHYWARAGVLQSMNLGKMARAKIGDDLQDNVPIYDTVQRRYAGFSNVLEQAWYGKKAPKAKINKQAGRYVDTCFQYLNVEQWLYVCLVHRITGSGASFSTDHGWRNTVVPNMLMLREKDWLDFIRSHPGPMFTSIGNQTPPFNEKTNDAYRTAGQQYLVEVAPELINRMMAWFRTMGTVGIKSAVDKALEIQTSLGCKRFKFVLTAWVMDIAQYKPKIVDPLSDCYHGKNAIETMEMIFDRPSHVNVQCYYDTVTQFLAQRTGTYPMDVEDVCCDLIRWFENYVPSGSPQFYNSSSLAYGGQRAA